ncbi:MAG: site-specific integrase [Candidatus Sedimenticola sp. (ex Thyasira tokunagai)]
MSASLKFHDSDLISVDTVWRSVATPGSWPLTPEVIKSIGLAASDAARYGILPISPTLARQILDDLKKWRSPGRGGVDSSGPLSEPISALLMTPSRPNEALGIYARFLKSLLFAWLQLPDSHGPSSQTRALASSHFRIHIKSANYDLNALKGVISAVGSVTGRELLLLFRYHLTVLLGKSKGHRPRYWYKGLPSHLNTILKVVASLESSPDFAILDFGYPVKLDPDEYGGIASAPSLELKVDLPSYLEDGEPDPGYIEVKLPPPPGSLPSSTDEFERSVGKSRFWIWRYHDPARFDTHALNHIEQLAFVQALAALKESDENQYICVALMYYLGVEIPLLLGLRLGIDLKKGGIFEKQIPRPPKARKIEDFDTKWLQPYSDVVNLDLPSSISMALDQFLNSFNTGQTLGCVLELEETQVRGKLVAWLRGLPDFCYRINEYRIRRTAFHRTMVRTRDLQLGNILYGSQSDTLPTESYYGSYDNVDVRIEHCNTGTELGGQFEGYKKIDEASARIGSVISPRHSLLKCEHQLLARNTYNKLFSISESKFWARKFDDSLLSDLVDGHNQYVQYIGHMIAASIGHRPVQDPFPFVFKIEPELGFAMIEDKVADESRRERFVVLPGVLIDQIKCYISHLDSLSKILYRIGQRSIAKDIWCLTKDAGKTARIPFIFNLLITEKVITADHFTYKQAYEYRLPFNWGRHDFTAFFRSSEQRAQLASIQCGHISGLKHPFGKESNVSTADFLKLLDEPVNKIAERQGWTAVNGLKVDIRNGNEIARFSGDDGNGLLSGVEERRIVRQKKSEKWKRKIRAYARLMLYRHVSRIDEKLIQSMSDQVKEFAIREGQGLTKSRKILATEISDVVARMINEGSLDACVASGIDLTMIGWPTRYKQLAAEPSPFEDDFVSNLGLARRLRSAFINYCNTAVLCDRSDGVYRKLSELLVSAVLFDGLVIEEYLINLSHEIPVHCFKLDGQVFVDIQVAGGVWTYRWVPTSISRFWLKKLECFDSENIVEKKLRSEVQCLLDDIGVRDVKTLAGLVRVGFAFWQFNLPGHLFLTCSKSKQYTPLPLSALVRGTSGRPADLPIQDITLTHKKPRGRVKCVSNNLQQGKVLWSQVSALLKSIMHSSVRNSVKKDRISDGLRKLLSQPDYPEAGYVLLEWGISLCDKGTRRKKVKATTIDTYLRLVFGSVIEVCSELPFLSLDGDDYEDLYMSCVLGRQYSRYDRGGRLEEFHYFVTSTYAVDDDINWQEIRQTKEPLPAAAQYLFPHEYALLLKLIDESDQLTIIEKAYVQFLAIVIYRFGLRSGEVFRLRLCDIQLDGHGSCIIQVRNSIHGETKSLAGVRQVPLVEEMTDHEKLVFFGVLDASRTVGEIDSNALIMVDKRNPRVAYRKHEIRGILGQALKLITGETSIRPHSLRHTWLTRIMAHLHIASSSEACKWIKRLLHQEDESTDVAGVLYGVEADNYRSLAPVARVIGHSQFTTTSANYFHSAEWMIADKIAAVELPICGDTGIAYITAQTEESVRQFRYRNDIGNRDLSLYCKLYSKRRVVGTSVGIRCKKNIDTLSLTRGMRGEQDVSLLDIDDVLSVCSDYDYTSVSRNLGRMLLLPQELIENILSVAMSIERKSGFLLYAVSCLDGDLIKNQCPTRSGSDIDKAQPELIRFLTELNELSYEKLNYGASLWCDNFDSVSMMPVFVGERDLGSYVGWLRKVGAKDLQAYIINSDEQAISKIDALLEKLKIDDVHQTTRRGGFYNPAIGITIKRSNDGGVSFNTRLNRALFLACIKCAICSASDVSEGL